MWVNGANLASVRESAGLADFTVAQEAKISLGQYREMESGRKNIKRDIVERVARILSVDVAEITCNVANVAEEIKAAKKETIEDEKIPKPENHCRPEANDLDWLCPFRDEKHKRCNIYDVRPSICKFFRCDMQFDTTAITKKAKKERRCIDVRMTFYPRAKYSEEYKAFSKYMLYRHYSQAQGNKENGKSSQNE